MSDEWAEFRKIAAEYEGKACPICGYGDLHLEEQDWCPADLMMRCDGCERDIPIYLYPDGKHFLDKDGAR